MTGNVSIQIWEANYSNLCSKNKVFVFPHVFSEWQSQWEDVAFAMSYDVAIGIIATDVEETQTIGRVTPTSKQQSSRTSYFPRSC